MAVLPIRWRKAAKVPSGLLPFGTLNIGVTGHRRNKLGDGDLGDIRKTLADLLRRLEAARAAVVRTYPEDFADQGRLRIITMLASVSPSSSAIWRSSAHDSQDFLIATFSFTPVAATRMLARSLA